MERPLELALERKLPLAPQLELVVEHRLGGCGDGGCCEYGGSGCDCGCGNGCGYQFRKDGESQWKSWNDMLVHGEYGGQCSHQGQMEHDGEHGDEY